MKVSMAIASSINGAITRGANKNMAWLSEEDNELFRSLRKESDVVIMGGNAYRTIKSQLKPTTYLRIVMTRHPNEFANEAIKDKLEFTDEAPADLLGRLKSAGYKNVLLAGGKSSNLFLKQNLVDEIHWTIEPIYIGSGDSMLENEDFTSRLKLISTEQLSDDGTLYLRYEVLR